MSGGVRHDTMIKSFVIKANSARGSDVVLACQYFDSVIFDCITSNEQLPVRVPLNLEDLTSFEKGITWDSMEIGRDCAMI